MSVKKKNEGAGRRRRRERGEDGVQNREQRREKR